MRTLHRYVLGAFVTTFAIALVVLTFVMTVGLVFGSLKYIARGMSAALVLRFLWQNLPGTLSYTVPVAALVSSLLVFSRLSSDSEIAAMRACGVPLGAVMRTPVLLSAALSFLCLYVNDSVAPDATYTRALRRKTFKLTDATALVEPGTWTEIGEYDMFVARRDGPRLRDLRVNQPLPNGKIREIRAASALVSETEDGETVLDMSDVTIDPIDPERPGMLRAATWQLPVAVLSGADGRDAAKKREDRDPPRRRTKDMPTWELAREIAFAARVPPESDAGRREISRAKTEIANRFALAAACFCFVLAGIPLGLQSHRKQSSAGLGIAMAVAGAFYFFCITAESLSKNPSFPAYWLPLVPVAACLVLSVCLTRRND
ncbi:MAG: LptF/LptG family permease [Kiritimatiellae bacterium]|nr:LptF/LptG family permease [Kiritimatiellia bacterium]